MFGGLVNFGGVLVWFIFGFCVIFWLFLRVIIGLLIGISIFCLLKIVCGIFCIGWNLGKLFWNCFIRNCCILFVLKFLNGVMFLFCVCKCFICWKVFEIGMVVFWIIRFWLGLKVEVVFCWIFCVFWRLKFCKFWSVNFDGGSDKFVFWFVLILFLFVLLDVICCNGWVKWLLKLVFLLFWKSFEKFICCVGCCGLNCFGINVGFWKFVFWNFLKIFLDKLMIGWFCCGCCCFCCWVVVNVCCLVWCIKLIVLLVFIIFMLLVDEGVC